MDANRSWKPDPGYWEHCFPPLPKHWNQSPRLNSTALYRIADFHEWGAAAAEATGIGKDNFEKSLARMYNGMSSFSGKSNSLQWADPLIEALATFMSDKPFWEGYASDLVELLVGLISELKPCSKDPAQLGKRMRQVIEPLSPMGIHIEILSKDSKGIAL